MSNSTNRASQTYSHSILFQVFTPLVFFFFFRVAPSPSGQSYKCQRLKSPLNDEVGYPNLPPLRLCLGVLILAAIERRDEVSGLHGLPNRHTLQTQSDEISGESEHDGGILFKPLFCSLCSTVQTQSPSFSLSATFLKRSALR